MFIVQCNMNEKVDNPMADQAKPVTDVVAAQNAEKAFSDAAATSVEKPVKKAAVKKPAAKKAPVAKAAAKTVAKPAVKAAAKTSAAKPALAKKTAAPKTTVKKATIKKTSPAKTVAAKKAVTSEAANVKKENVMSKATDTIKETTETMTARAKELFGTMSTQAKTAYEKGSEYVSQANEFNKANIEALVESGKIAAKGAQDMGQTYAADLRTNFAETTSTLKEYAAVKSPTEFFQLHVATIRKAFDTGVAQTSKNTEQFVKIAGEVVQPISNRVSETMETFKKAA